jgi:4-diphosphocytidyl-2-C-methyl-D-erythritol kinase
VLGISRFEIGTPDVFRRWDVLGPAGEPAGLGMLLAALDGGDPERIGPLLHNDLARAAADLDPRLGPLEDAMRSAGVLGAAVSGSGPTVMGLCRDEAHAHEAAARARPAFDRVEVAASAPVGAEIVSVRVTAPGR